jgi:undecaprenyl-diphosphatase
MNTVESIVLGAVQGLTEFLPVSSSGHLVIAQNLFGIREPQLSFDVAVHLGTLMAVFIYFRKDIHALTATLMRCFFLILKGRWSELPSREDPDMKWILMICAGSIPTAIIGLLFHEISDRLFSSVLLVGIMLSITGILLWFTRGIRKQAKTMTEFSLLDAVVIGLVQGIAVLPGISRSGSTISTAIYLGVSRETAARFSFLLSIPAIFGATLLTAKDMTNEASFDAATVLFGMLTSGIVGYLALSLLVYIVNQGRLHYFSPYCWLLGLISVFISMG